MASNGLGTYLHFDIAERSFYTPAFRRCNCTSRTYHTLTETFKQSTVTMDGMPMDASPTSTATVMSDMMTPWLHFAGGDFLYFSGVHPSSHGALAAASIVLFLLALAERWLFAFRGYMEAHWRARLDFNQSNGSTPLNYLFSANAILRQHNSEVHESDRSDLLEGKNEGGSSGVVAPSARKMRTRTIAPFIAQQDIPRGLLHALQAFFTYTLMLAVMFVLFFSVLRHLALTSKRTFQAAYIIAIIAGLGIGEMAFGRIAEGSGVHVHWLIFKMCFFCITEFLLSSVRPISSTREYIFHRSLYVESVGGSAEGDSNVVQVYMKICIWRPTTQGGGIVAQRVRREESEKVFSLFSIQACPICWEYS